MELRRQLRGLEGLLSIVVIAILLSGNAHGRDLEGGDQDPSPGKLRCMASIRLQWSRVAIATVLQMR